MGRPRPPSSFELQFLVLWTGAWLFITVVLASVAQAISRLRDAMSYDLYRWEGFWEFEYHFPFAEYVITTVIWILLSILMWRAIAAPMRGPSLPVWIGVVAASQMANPYVYEFMLLLTEQTTPVVFRQIGVWDYFMAFTTDVLSWCWLVIVFLFVGWRQALCMAAAVVLGSGILMTFGLASYANSFLADLTAVDARYPNWGLGLTVDELRRWITETTIAALVSGAAIVAGDRLDRSADDASVFS
ncbi:MAG: hypothetical protein AAGJ28_16360 [Pseudomonadota bacterium]